MATVDCTAFFRDDDAHGWSEQHQIDGGSSNPALLTFLNAFDNLMLTFRVPLLGRDAFYIGCRVSYRTANRKVAGTNRLQDVPVAGPPNVGTRATWLNLASDAVKTRFQDVTATANSDVYLRGIPDDVIEAGQLNFTGAVGAVFKTNLVNYQTELIAKQYGWTGINPTLTPRGEVLDVVQDGDGRVTFTLNSTNGVPIPSLTGKFNVRFAQINGGKSILNRTFVCTQTDATHVKTVKQVSFGSFDSPGTFVLPIKGFIKYNTAAYNRADSRKTGRPFGAGRGRLAAQTLH